MGRCDDFTDLHHDILPLVHNELRDASPGNCDHLRDHGFPLGACFHTGHMDYPVDGPYGAVGDFWSDSEWFSRGSDHAFTGADFDRVRIALG